jgi:hypothetical protein
MAPTKTEPLEPTKKQESVRNMEAVEASRKLQDFLHSPELRKAVGDYVKACPDFMVFLEERGIRIPDDADLELTLLGADNNHIEKHKHCVKVCGNLGVISGCWTECWD